ncbi:hypothetical protein AB0K34_11025 [Actinomadura sp. NPDC049382]|uniref:hypothetical protein n=1 Tax=Actinomadura sp. NPDC049382 TaxID=3158220 RepID=UPI00342E010A
MAALITFADLTARPGFDNADQAEAEAVITDASALVIQIADLATPWTADTVPDVVVPVLVNMVRRGLSNPLGLSGEQLGDYGWQAQGGGAMGLYATRQERAIIRRAAGTLGAKNATLDSDLPLPAWRGAGAGFENEFLDSL